MGKVQRGRRKNYNKPDHKKMKNHTQAHGNGERRAEHESSETPEQSAEQLGDQPAEQSEEESAEQSEEELAEQPISQELGGRIALGTMELTQILGGITEESVVSTIASLTSAYYEGFSHHPELVSILWFC